MPVEINSVEDAKLTLAKVETKLQSPDLTPDEQQRLLEAKRMLEIAIRLRDNPRGRAMDRRRKARAAGRGTTDL